MPKEKLITLQKIDLQIKELRDKWENNSLDANIYLLEDNILKRKVIENGLLHTPILVPGILREGTNDLSTRQGRTQWFQKDLLIPKNEVLLERHEKIHTRTLHTASSMRQAQYQNSTTEK